MNNAIQFHPRTPHDIADAIAWYEEISPILGNRFRAALREAFAKIGSHPLTYAVAFDDVRIVRVSRFPFLVQYKMRSDTPLVLGIFHSASDPGKWHKRASDDAR
jgi:toxin ParE1/3/4